MIGQIVYSGMRNTIGIGRTLTHSKIISCGCDMNSESEFISWIKSDY